MDYQSPRKLWYHVILQALRDINYINPDDIDNPNKNDLLSWMCSKDYTLVCDMAGVNPDWLENKIKILFNMRKQGLKLFICRGEYADSTVTFN